MWARGLCDALLLLEYDQGDHNGGDQRHGYHRNGDPQSGGGRRNAYDGITAEMIGNKGDSAVLVDSCLTGGYCAVIGYVDHLQGLILLCALGSRQGDLHLAAGLNGCAVKYQRDIVGGKNFRTVITNNDFSFLLSRMIQAVTTVAFKVIFSKTSINFGLPFASSD